jgi:hypothetical protein
VSAICLLASLIMDVNLLTSVSCSLVLTPNASSAAVCFRSKSSRTSAIAVTKVSTGPYAIRWSSPKFNMNPPQVLDYLKVYTLCRAELDIWTLVTHMVLAINNKAMRIAFILYF